MRIGRSVARVAVGMLVVMPFGLSGCSSGAQPHSSSSGAPSTDAQPAAVPKEPPGGYDISRIAQLSNQFPPGYSVTPIGPITLTQEQADLFIGFTKKLGSTFDPPQCAEALKHPMVLAGSKVQGLAAHGPQEIMVAMAQTAQPIPTFVPVDACKHVTFNEPGKLQGTVDHLPAPTIDGVTTICLKVHLDITESGISKTIDQYQYQAALSDQTGVEVTGQSDTQLLEGLLTKAVTAVRGH
jgi:hypothetical protein